MIMSHTLTKVLTVGDLRVDLNGDGELEISTKRGVVVTLNDAGDLGALHDLVRDARIACGDPLVGNPQVGDPLVGNPQVRNDSGRRHGRTGLDCDQDASPSALMPARPAPLPPLDGHRSGLRPPTNAAEPVKAKASS